MIIKQKRKKINKNKRNQFWLILEINDLSYSVYSTFQDVDNDSENKNITSRKIQLN